MSDYHDRIMNIATEPGIEELERGDRLLYKYGHQVARHATAEIAAEAEEEITRLQADNEALRARVAELEQWQAAVFDAHPNIDIDIDRALDRQSVEGGECSRCNGSGVIPAADKRIGTWGCKDCGGTGSA